MKYLYEIDLFAAGNKADGSLPWPEDQLISTELNSYITINAMGEIYRLAIEQYPRECCGLILQQGIRPCENVQDQLHRSDPISYPRTSASAFTFSGADSLFLSRNIDTANPVKVIYHSHPDVGAYFSSTDKANALYGDQPIYPIDHLVIDVQSHGVICAKLFRFIAAEYTLIAILPGSNDNIWGNQG
jgi:proteasome lid subunit RPN8/RPN11